MSLTDGNLPARAHRSIRADQNSAETWIRDTRFWLPPLIGVVLYPALMILFRLAMSGFRQSSEPLPILYAVLLMLLAGSIPVIVLRALTGMRGNAARNSILTQGLLYLMFGVSPLFVLVIQFAAKAGITQHFVTIWVLAWIAAGVTLYFAKGGDRATTGHGAGMSWLRIIHGGAALCLLVGFLVAHLVNHDLAVWSVDLHGVVMDWLRHWYRSAWVEPLLFGLLAVMAVTGVPMVLHYLRSSKDVFRIIQMATGIYVGLFLCAHLFAVLSARSAGVETDWAFATGPNGLLDGRGMLIPYYILAAFFLILHVGCGLRIVALKHNVAEPAANRAVYLAAAIGIFVTVLIAIPALGFHVQSL